MESVETIIIVPARSGSKGIPDKNIRLLGGKPLLAWTAEAVSQADLPNSKAILSTDSPVYAEIGRQFGFEVPFLRPVEYSSDTASAMQVAEHALFWFMEEFGYSPTYTLWLQPTSPFRRSDAMKQAYTTLAGQEADAVVGCKAIHRDLTTLFRCENRFMSPLSQRPIQTTRQQVHPLLTPNGAMYFCRTALLLERHSFYPERTVPVLMNAIQSLDIDTEDEWVIAEAFIQQGLV